MKKEITLNVSNTRNIKKVIVDKFESILREREVEHFKTHSRDGLLIRRGFPGQSKKRFEQCFDSYIEKLNNGELEKLIFEDFYEKNKNLITEEFNYATSAY